MMLPAGLHERWDALAPREKAMVLAAAVLVTLSLVWWVAVAPALQVLRASPQRHQVLDAELARMRGLAERAKVLQSQPKPGYDDTLRALESAVRQRLGPAAVLSVVGDRATVTLKGASAETLSQWLAQVRINAHASPVEVRLQRTVTAPAAPAAWDGTVLLSLPPR
jgi:general secretion pathway protein M